jgi:signal transduction histidine kinase/CheY-like chemotaxis protein
MPGTTFLPVAGPLGTILGLVLGTLVMLAVAACYHYLMQLHPDAGGAYSYVKRICTHDHAFLCAWFLILAYVAIVWANATALALIGRNFLGGIFQAGFRYTIAGYDVYAGELALCVGVLAVVGAGIGFGSRRLASRAQTLLSLLLMGGILAAFAAVVLRRGGFEGSFSPAFAPGKGRVAQVVCILALTPWAFVGFESVSHAVEGFHFPRKRAFGIMAASLGCGLVAYAALAVVAACARPGGFSDWPTYVKALPDLAGQEALPVFYAVESALGRPGFALLAVTTWAAVLTALIGHIVAASRLMHAMAHDGILPAWFGELTGDHNPRNAQLFLVAVSCAVLFVGRTAIGWIVEVTTIGACIVYGYVGACAFLQARADGCRGIAACGLATVAAAIGFAVYFLVPNAWTVEPFAPEAYLFLAVWAIIGSIGFLLAFRADSRHRFGKSLVVWVVLLALIFYAAHMWVRQANHGAAMVLIQDVEARQAAAGGAGAAPAFAEAVHDDLEDAITRFNSIQLGIVVFSLVILAAIFATMSRREREAAHAKSYFFSTVSHDLRTPLNAIIGYSRLLRMGPSSGEERDRALDSIVSGGNTLLQLVDDIIDLSRLEAGRTNLHPVPCDSSRILGDLADAFRHGARPGVDLRWETRGLPLLLLDPARLRQIAFTLVGNAVKYTEKGHIEVRAEWTRTGESDFGTFRFEVEDTGVGIGHEDLARITDAYVKIGSKLARHGGTGLGLAICRRFAESLGGSLAISSVVGQGSTFTLEVPEVRLAPADAVPAAVPPASETLPETPAVPLPEAAPAAAPAPAAVPAAFRGRRFLIADDSRVNLAVLKGILKKLGAEEIVTANDGREAWQALLERTGAPFDAVLTDMWMPGMDGAELVRAIRASAPHAGLPVHAVTADVELGETHADDGFDGIILKPVTAEKLSAIPLHGTAPNG